MRSMFIPCALRGIEASLRMLVCASCVLSFFKVVWSVLSLLDGLPGCDHAFCVVWLRFLMLRRYLACRPGVAPGVYRLLDSAAEGCPGHGLRICLLRVLLRLGFSWIPVSLGGSVLDCPC